MKDIFIGIARTYRINQGFDIDRLLNEFEVTE